MLRQCVERGHARGDQIVGQLPRGSRPQVGRGSHVEKCDYVFKFYQASVGRLSTAGLGGASCPGGAGLFAWAGYRSAIVWA